MNGIEIIEVDELEVYKVLGDEGTIEEFADARAPGMLVDWSAIYLQYSEAHASGTVGYRWDQGYSIARMDKVLLGELKVIVLKDAIFSDGEITGEEKAQVVRGMLASQCGIEVPTSSPLMSALGEMGYCLTCEETPGEWELVISPTLLLQSTIMQNITSEYRPKYGATAYWREDPDAPWGPYNESERLDLPTPSPAWLDEVLIRT